MKLKDPLSPYTNAVFNHEINQPLTINRDDPSVDCSKVVQCCWGKTRGRDEDPLVSGYTCESAYEGL